MGQDNTKNCQKFRKLCSAKVDRRNWCSLVQEEGKNIQWTPVKKNTFLQVEWPKITVRKVKQRLSKLFWTYGWALKYMFEGSEEYIGGGFEEWVRQVSAENDVAVIVCSYLKAEWTRTVCLLLSFFLTHKFLFHYKNTCLQDFKMSSFS